MGLFILIYLRVKYTLTKKIMLDQKTIKGELFQNDGRFGNCASFSGSKWVSCYARRIPFYKTYSCVANVTSGNKFSLFAKPSNIYLCVTLNRPILILNQPPFT